MQTQFDMGIKAIKTEADYEIALDRLKSIFQADANMSIGDEAVLNVIKTLSGFETRSRDISSVAYSACTLGRRRFLHHVIIEEK